MGFKNYLSVELGGVSRGLKFNVGTLKCLQDIIGSDPLQYKVASESFNDILPYAVNVVHAALLSNCLSKKTDPDFTAEDVKAWVDDLSVGDLEVIINHYNSIFLVPKPSVNGEVGKDTQTVNV